jgi:tetratricopeptide (TPR) repeat protein
MSTHVWCVGEYRGEADLVLDCDRRLRGPYTGLGSLLRSLVPQVNEYWPDLVRRHAIEILSVASELAESIDAAPATLTSLAVPSEQTRIYAVNRTRRLAHGLVEFLESYAGLADRALTFSFVNVDQADHTDHEFLAIALRRARGGRVTLVVGTRGEDLPAELSTALDNHARKVETEIVPVRADYRDDDQLLRDYIGSDGTSDDPAERAAYDRADAAVRVDLHEARAEELRQRGEWSLHLGAIPYHLEHGRDPATAGGQALLAAATYCFLRGFYHILLDYGPRGRAITDVETQMKQYWFLSTRASTALGVLGRTEEAEPILHELRSLYTDPVLQVNTGYALAMLYTRFHPPERRDHRLAKAHLNNSIAIASLLPDPQERAFYTVFNQNGLALAEMHLGNLSESLRLVHEGLDRLNRELNPDKHRLHRSVLLYNRAKVYAAMGRLDDALVDFDSVIELDPNYPDYYFDRADIKRRLGDLGGALADYDTAVPLAPAFFELHYNRADLRVEVGDIAGAITDLSYVVELEPDQLDARMNLVSLMLDAGELAEARSHVEEGLRLHPEEPRLFHARGLLALEHGDIVLAGTDFDLALDMDARFVAALASRAGLAFDSGEHDAAISDLTTAIDADGDNPDLLYNRGFVRQSAGRLDEAVADYTRALALPDADRTELLRQIALCQAELASAP